jgi:serine-type D-Ala-D-Ala carboxypeptidase (penicillin-binding protein 5/6)
LTGNHCSARACPCQSLRVGLVLLVIALLALAAIQPRCALAAPPHMSARAAVLIERSTGRRLVGDNADARLAIASTTKLMTALVTLEHVHRLSRIFTQNNYYPAAADSQIGLVPGERMSVHDLMVAMLLPSADDAAEDLAYNVGRGSIGRFVAMMNARARQLGLTHTHYSTPSGLDTPGNYSSASDLVRLASYVLTHQPFFARVVAERSAVLHTGSRPRYVVNRNDLVGRYTWINGVKTGHTAAAGYVLVGQGTRDGMTLISAVLGTSSEGARDANTLALLDYGFRTFHFVTPIHGGAVLARPTVRDRPGVHASVLASRSFTTLARRGAPVRVVVRVPGELAGPLPRHAVVGTAEVRAGGRVLARIPLLLAEKLPAVSPLTLAARFLTRGTTLVMLVALLLLAGGFVGLRHWRARDRDAKALEGA